MKSIRFVVLAGLAGLAGTAILGKPALAEGSCDFLQPGVCQTFEHEVCYGAPLNYCETVPIHILGQVRDS